MTGMALYPALKPGNCAGIVMISPRHAVFESLDEALSVLGQQSKNQVILYLEEQIGTKFTPEALDLRRIWNYLRSMFGTYAEIAMAQTYLGACQRLQVDPNRLPEMPAFDRIMALLSDMSATREAAPAD